jgi:3-oxoadipate enol-lactonase
VTSGLVLCASSRNFLGTLAERMTSLLAPAITLAARLNPLLYALGAGVLGPQVINDLNGERRQYALTEMNRTSMTTVVAALVAASEFTSHEWIGQIDVPVSVLVTTRDTIVPPGRQRRLAEAIPHATVVTVEGDHAVCVSDPARFSAKLVEACLATQAGVIPPSRSATRRQLPGAHRTAADAG